MKLFSHTLARWRCAGCFRAYPGTFPNFHVAFGIATIAASCGFWIRECLRGSGLPWYGLFGFQIAEMLLMLLVSLLCYPVLSRIQKVPRCCPTCGGAPRFAGESYQASSRPHWSDLMILGVFLMVNLGAWLLT